MKRLLLTTLGAGLVLLNLGAGPLHPEPQEPKTIAAATSALEGLSVLAVRGIPHTLLRDAVGVAIIPHVVKVGLVIDKSFGRGVLLVHHPTGRWSDPIFITLSGGGIGGQVGVESTDLVLVFKTKKSLERALQGRLTLGSDVSVAAGPIGREAEVASDRGLRTEIFTYSRSRGLFVGLSVEGARLHIDGHANEVYYGLHEGDPGHVLGRRGPGIPAAEYLKEHLERLSTPPAPPAPPPAPVIIVPKR
jgi:lipid-binding SYLF domain-containing protein